MTAEQQLIQLSHDWDRTMVTNDAEAIGRFMADDWTIVGSDGRISRRDRFLELIRSGQLSHDVMTSEDIEVRVYGDSAVVTARGVSGGKWQSQPFREVERVSCYFANMRGEWKCVHTHLSKLAE